MAKKEKSINIIYHCNEWQEYSSFRFIAAVDDDHLEKALKKIKRECQYNNDEMEKYIYVDYVIINEINV